MSQLRRRVTGSFTEGLEELLPALAVQPTQLNAAADPNIPSAMLIGRRRRVPRRVLERRINELLSGERLH